MTVDCRARHFWIFPAVVGCLLIADRARAESPDADWLAAWRNEQPVMEKPWALGVKTHAATGGRLRTSPVVPAVINRAWPATVALAQPGRSRKSSPVVTGALPVAYTPYSAPSAGNIETTGIASFYWQDQMTASGERFDKTAMTAAHKTLPLHTRVRVTRLDTGQSVIVRINDRGPFKPGRIIDLSDAAAGALNMRSMGLAQVKIDVVR